MLQEEFHILIFSYCHKFSRRVTYYHVPIEIDVTLLLHLIHHIIIFLHIFHVKQKVMLISATLSCHLSMHQSELYVDQWTFSFIISKNIYWALFLGKALKKYLSPKYGIGTLFLLIQVFWGEGWCIFGFGAKSWLCSTTFPLYIKKSW